MRRRLGPPLAGIGGAFVLMAFVAAAESGVVVGIALTFLVMGLVSLALRSWRARRPGPPGAWGDGATTPRFTPAAVQPPATPRRVAFALSTVEAREIVLSAAFGVGLGFCFLMLILFGVVWGPDWGGNLPRAVELYPIYAHPLVGMIVIASHRARTRSRRDGSDEIFDSCPTDQGTRTTGHLATAWVPAVALLVFLVILTALSLRSFPAVYGGFGTRQIAVFLGAALLGIGGTCLGVALARWTPWSLAPVVALIGLAFATVRLSTWGGSTDFSNAVRQLSTWLGDSPVDLRFTAPNWLAHHVWILALVGLTAVVALARDHRSPRLAAMGTATVAVAIASGVVAAQPMDAGAAERIASLINDPAEHQVCIDAEGLPICVYRGDTALAESFVEELSPVVAAAPQGALAGWVLRYGHTAKLRHLDPAVRDRLRLDGRDEGVIPAELHAHPHADQGARLWTALTAVGLRDSPTTNLAGQARGVVALWLATRSAEAEVAAAMTSMHLTVDPGDPRRFRPWPDPCLAGPAPVSWAGSDLEAARLLMARPETDVRRALHAQWERFTDPATTTDELLAHFSIAPVREPRALTPAGLSC